VSISASDTAYVRTVLCPDPIPADLWRRLARLDARCDITILRRDANRPGHRHTTGRNYDREWRVEVQEKGCVHRGPMTVEGGCSLRRVLEDAVESAEQNGWHMPGFVGPPTHEEWVLTA
jgi:hypothetical protein